MPSPQKKKRGKRNGKRAKRSKTASTPTRPRKKKSIKRGSYKQFSKEEKDIRDALIENAAKSIIKARANNPKNKPGGKLRVPHGMYKEKADGINQFTNGRLEVTVNDLENKVRSIDKATNAVASTSTQPIVASTAAAISTSTMEDTKDVAATESHPAFSAKRSMSASHVSTKIVTSDKNANDSNAAGKIKISPSDSDTATASGSGISPRRLESTLNAASSSSSSSSSSIPPLPSLQSITSRSDRSTATASLSETNMLPSEPIPSSYIMDNSQAVPQSSMDALRYPMRDTPRLNPGVEGYVYEAGQIIISHLRKPSLSLSQENYSRLNPNVWLCDGLVDFFGQGVLQEETSETHFYSSHFVSALLKFEDEVMQFPNAQAIEQIRQTYVDGDILDMADCGGGGNQDFYDFSRVKTWHMFLSYLW